MLSKSSSHLIHFFAIVSLSYFLASCGDGEGPEQVTDPALPLEEAYTLVWADEFDEDGAPNVKNWNIEEGAGGWGNEEWQTYTDDAENVRVEGGNLVISAQCSNATTDPALCNTAGDDGTITSARINSKDKFEVKYGNIQARIKVPPGKGTWPAFWMLGANFPEQPWPRVGEIDIVEIHQFYSDIFTTHFAMHWCDDSIQGPVPCEFNPGWVFEAQYKKFDFAFSDDYHIFEADWDEDRIVGKIDGNAYFSFPIDPATREEFLSKFFMILNVAVGGTLGGPPNDSTTWPQEMLVDWVRVYEKNKPEEVELVPDDTESPFTYENFVRIVNSVEFGGDSVVSTVQRTVSEDDEKFDDITPPAVTPLTGNTIVEFDYQSANTFFSGAAFLFKQKDITHYEKIVFSLDTTMFPNFHDIAIEMNDNRFTGDGAPGKVSIPLSTYKPIATSGNWATYEVPLTDFVGVNLDNVASWGFWNPQNSAGQLIAGKLYLDDIRLVNVPCTANGIVSFNSDTINGNQSSTQVSVTDTCLANKNETVVVVIDNGVEAIGVNMPIVASGLGIATVNFGPTKDANSTIATNEGDVLTASYTDANGVTQTDTATVSTKPLAVYSETKVDNVLVYTDITNESTITKEASTAVTALEGSVLLQSDFSIPASGDENGYTFNFADASGGLLANGSFEVPDATGAPIACDFNPPSVGTIIQDWECINFPFVVTVGDGPVAHEGSQVIEAGVIDAIVQQSVPVSPGDAVDISVWAMNWNDKPLTGIAIMQLNFLDAVDNVIEGYEVLGSADGSQTYTLAGKAGTAAGDWTLMELSGVAPAGTVNAQIFLLHVKGGGTNSSKVYWDDASLTVNSVSSVTSDVSYFKTLKFGINSAGSGLMDLDIRMQDAASNVATVFLSDYMPTTSAVADWDIYEIPLSNFTGIDLSDIRSLGFYNASSTVAAPSAGSVTYFATTLYIDDLHFALDSPATLTGVLVNSPIEGATYSTMTQSGITNASGEFQYLPGEDVTFSIGDIDLGTVKGAPVVTPVELTGSANPTDQAATNQLIFIQSIDADQDSSNGITISLATQAAAVGQTLDFTLNPASFIAAISGPAGIVSTIAPGNAIVSETDAVNNFYQSFPPMASVTNTTIDANIDTVNANGTDTITITVQAKDSSGNNITVSAGPVTLSSSGNAVVSSPVLDNGDGTYTVTVTNLTAESVIITGTIDGNLITDNAGIIFLGAVSLADTTIDAVPSTLEADGISVSTITVQVKDANGNDFVSSAGVGTVALYASYPSSGIMVLSVSDNNNGTYTATVTNNAVENVNVVGTIDGNQITDNAMVSFIVGAVDATKTTIVATPENAAVDNGTNTSTISTITVQAVNNSGNNINGSVGAVTLDASFPSTGTVPLTVTDNNNGTYVATLTNTVAEIVTITGTIDGTAITDSATVLFGPTAGVVSDTNIDSLLSASAPGYSPSGCDPVVVDDNVPTGTYPSYEGAVSTSTFIAGVTTCIGSVINFGDMPGSTIAPYSQDFEGLDPLSATALSEDGWLLFGAGFDSTNTTQLYTYGVFPAPTTSGQISAIATGEGSTAQGVQYMNIYSDYNNGDHATGNWVRTSVFQEQTIAPGLPTGIYTFTFDAKRPGVGWGTSSAIQFAFLKTLDPNNFGITSEVTMDMSSVSDLDWNSFTLSIDLAGRAGDILQFGTETQATNYEPSGVFYDNMSFVGGTIDVSGYAALKFAIDSADTSAPVVDIELKMEDANGGTASVFLSAYASTSANIVGANWQVYEIPVTDFTGTLDKTIMKTLSFLDPSSTVSAPPGIVTPVTGTLRTDDLYFIEQP